ncbi:hypothetical protein L2E82_39760 [Cichorium intybus]|uniref:Uncharacterized protein n=1 Tax=Cichorium intybus TaxID=13427 RepID=A0ACB9AIG3_CICIN|nr:hypothetical protein L2E82_39760 [Cichorium intybus]
MAWTSAAEPSSAKKESPNWLEMPHELMVNVFQRLPTVEILNSARKVCTTWLKICKYPAMWKVINMLQRPVDRWGWDSRLEALTKEAVDLSRGELIDISIDWFGTYELLDYIVRRSSKLKRLCLLSCLRIRDCALSQAVKRVPQLEELHLSETIVNAQEIEVIGQNCPQLKSFKMNKVYSDSVDDQSLAIANNMPELRHLELIENEITNDGLEAILNGCPHLQSLDVRMCHYLDLDGYLGKMCMELIKDFKHGLTDCGFDVHISDVEDFSEDDMYDDFSERDFFID